MLLKTQGKTNLQIQKLLSFKRKGTDNHCREPTTRALRVLENNKPYRPIKSLQKICVAIPTGLKGEARHMLSCGDRFRRRCIRWWVQENLFYPICNTSQIILLGVELLVVRYFTRVSDLFCFPPGFNNYSPLLTTASVLQVK